MLHSLKRSMVQCEESVNGTKTTARIHRDKAETTSGEIDQFFGLADAAAKAGFAALLTASTIVGYRAVNKSPLLKTAVAPASSMAVRVWSGTPAVSPMTVVHGR